MKEEIRKEEIKHKTLQAEIFKLEVFKLMVKYNLTISHEDRQGAFIIDEYNEPNVSWFLDAKLKGDDV